MVGRNEEQGGWRADNARLVMSCHGAQLPLAPYHPLAHTTH
jgi:hypothetical protein